MPHITLSAELEIGKCLYSLRASYCFTVSMVFIIIPSLHDMRERGEKYNNINKNGNFAQSLLGFFHDKIILRKKEKLGEIKPTFFE